MRSIRFSDDAGCISKLEAKILENGIIAHRSALVLRTRTSYSYLTILVTFWFILTSLVFVYSGKLLFHGFLLFKGNFLRRKKRLKIS